MPFKRKRDNKGGDDEEWLVTYADSVTLLLCFFIILFSVSEPQPSAYKKLAESLQAAGFIDEIPEDPVDGMAASLEAMVEENELEEVMAVEQTDKGLQLELSSSSFYESGSAKFKREAIPILKQVADILREYDYDAYVIAADGHTDDVPMRSATFPSNWELSAGRASNIVRFFIASGLSRELMQASGFADTRPKVPNLDEEGNPIPENREINRRVVIRVERVD